MKKTLVGVHNLDDFIRKECGAFYQDGSMILTAGAKDELNRRGIRIQYGGAPAGSCCAGGAAPAVDAAGIAGAASLEDLLVELAVMIREQCGISDPEQLRDASLKALQTIKDNID